MDAVVVLFDDVSYVYYSDAISWDVDSCKHIINPDCQGPLRVNRRYYVDLGLWAISK